MKNALEWIKSNPISVAAAAVGLIGLLVLVYFYISAAAGFRAEASKRVGGPAGQLTALLSNSVPMPAEDPNDPPIDQRVVINDVVNREVKRVYEDIGAQAFVINEITIGKNAQRHRDPLTMLGRGELWPQPNPGRSASIREQARQEYQQAVQSLFKPGNVGMNMPSFAAAMPPRQDEIQFKLNETAFNFINSIGVTAQTALTQAQAEQLYAEQRMELMKLLSSRARTINLYVELPAEPDPASPAAQPGLGEFSGPGPGGQLQQPGGFDDFSSPPGNLGSRGSGNQATGGYPFQLAAWTKEARAPTLDELWEAQVELWIIRDVMLGIHKANHVGEVVTSVDAQGQPVQAQANVLNSPIKRLITLKPLPFYVGLHTRGGVLVEDGNYAALGPGESLGGDSAGAGLDSSSSEFGDFSSPSTSSTGGTTAGTTSIYPNPPGITALPAPTEAAPNHFGLTPTGRVSNSVFDVRHTLLVIDIEWDALPGFMETLREINFMSVVKANLQDLDEYELLRQGFVYGGKDVVRAELVIESLWFREWTTPYMPKIVKDKLLVAAPQTP